MYKKWIHKIAQNAATLCKNKKIIIWGDYSISYQIKDLLVSQYRKEVFGYVDSDLPKTDSEKVFCAEYLKGKKDKYFIVIPLAFHQSIKDKLEEYGYLPEDYYYYNDCIIEDRDDYYKDARGNCIIGKRRNIKIVFNGDNSTVKIQEGEGIKSGGNSYHISIGSNSAIEINDRFLCKADFDIEDNVKVHIGESCVAAGKVHLMQDSYMELGNACHIDGIFTLSEDARLTIGESGYLRGELYIGSQAELKFGEKSRVLGNINMSERTVFHAGDIFTTERNCYIALPGDTSLLIGDDCMFSGDVVLLSNDAHSIFDLQTKENINSTPEENAARKIVIGNHVWIGYRAVILYKTIIGNGSIIGANSLVKGEIADNCIAAGNPARIVRNHIAWSREYGAKDISGCGMKYSN